MIKKILHITPDFNYTCGMSKLAFLYLKYFGSKEGYEVHFITNGGDSMERLKEISSLKLEILNFTRGMKNFLYQRKFLADLRNYVIKNDINLIHTHHRFPEYMSVKAVKGLNVKTVTSAHSFVKGFKSISFKSDKIIAVSDAVGAYIKNNFNVKGDRIETVYNPVENFPEINSEDVKNIKSKIGINPGDKVILFVGKINIEKGCDTLLKSFKKINEQNKNAFLLMCGNLEMKNLNKMIGGINVKFLEPRRDVQLLYSIADIIVLPSRVESFGFTMIEGGSYKKAFVGSRTGGIAEFIDDDINGLLAEPGDENEFADKILFTC